MHSCSSHILPGYPVCHPCTSECPNNSHISLPCRTDHDTQCACDNGYFLDNLRGSCQTCTGCPIGHGVLLDCTATRNTRCYRCPAGTFSDRSGFDRCVTCGVCGSDSIAMQQCTSYQDTVCICKFV